MDPAQRRKQSWKGRKRGTGKRDPCRAASLRTREN
jgi:hypothetical protein